MEEGEEKSLTVAAGLGQMLFVGGVDAFVPWGPGPCGGCVGFDMVMDDWAQLVDREIGVVDTCQERNDLDMVV